MWYEWHAESFLTVSGHGSGAPLARDGVKSPPPLEGSPLSSSVSAPSPLIDAVDIPTINLRSEGSGRVKIGQTSLHNPGGRSSFIGL